MAEIVCQRCAHPNSSASNFCSSCGFDLDRMNEEVTGQHPAITDASEPGMETVDHMESMDTTETTAVELQAAEAVFVVKRGPKAGSRFSLDKAVVSLGRHPESDIFLDDITVSRRHAEVRHEEAGFMVSDVSSLNGTYLNRERIEEASVRLTSGDEVQVGKFKLVFLTGDSQ